ncbi:MAG: xanthine dehydrogenase family protein molybdopterin-binding subunit [Pseudomonadota bacterium]
MNKTMTRRAFLKGTGLVLATVATPLGIELLNLSPSLAADSTFKPHAFLEIAADETVTIWVGQSELGQGIHTGIAMLLADEIGADWSKVRVKQALAAEPFKDPLWHAQLTAGSTSIRNRWDLFRNVGAAAREMLIAAAARQWGLQPSLCKAEDGKVTAKDGRSLSFGRLAAKAAALPVPKTPVPKPASEYKIIGSERPRFDIPDKVAGKAVFGMDVKVPGMCIAAVARPPAYGATPQSYDAQAAKAIKGVIAVVPLPDRVAVCAENTYAALQGKEALNIKWSEGSQPDLNTQNLDRWYEEYLGKPGVVAQNIGDAKAALGQAAKRLQATYKLPYLAHATLEPMNCTALVEKDRCRVWAPTQAQTRAQETAAKLTGLPPEKVEIMTTYCGGGFGRRGEPGEVGDAVLLSKELGRAVKVVWTREDDFKNDFYRPACLCEVQGGLDGAGRLIAWTHKVASSSIMIRALPSMMKEGVDDIILDGVINMDYSLPNRLVEYCMVNLPIPVGFWRSVGNSVNPFVVESFMDELAVAAGQDPLDFRLGLLEAGSRPRRLLEILAQKADWGSPKPDGRGLALRTCFESTVGHVAEVSVDRQTGKVTVHKLVGVIDCGTAVYPDAIKAQMQGGAVMALSAAFKERVVFDKGGVKTDNYDDYPLLSMTEVPPMDVHIAASGGKAGGVGEPVLVTVAPAVANAIFDAAGVRLRELPFDTGQLKKA